MKTNFSTYIFHDIDSEGKGDVGEDGGTEGEDDGEDGASTLAESEEQLSTLSCCHVVCRTQIPF